MSETTRVVVPYESMDPLAIGATDDESKKHRDTLEVDVPTASLLAVVQPDEPGPVGDPTEAARAALAAAGRRPDVRGAPRRARERRGRDRQPVPADAVLEAAAGGLRRDRRSRDHRRPRVLRQREGLPDVRVGHRAEGRPREPGPHGAERLVVLAERPAERGRVHVRGRLLRGDAGLAARRGRERRGEDHDRPGAGEPLGRRGRRQADPARASSPTRPSSRTTAPSSRPRRRTTARTSARCAPTSTRWRRCAGSTAR